MMANLWLNADGKIIRATEPLVRDGEFVPTLMYDDNCCCCTYPVGISVDITKIADCAYTVAATVTLPEDKVICSATLRVYIRGADGEVTIYEVDVTSGSGSVDVYPETWSGYFNYDVNVTTEDGCSGHLDNFYVWECEAYCGCLPPDDPTPPGSVTVGITGISDAYTNCADCPSLDGSYECSRVPSPSPFRCRWEFQEVLIHCDAAGVDVGLFIRVERDAFGQWTVSYCTYDATTGPSSWTGCGNWHRTVAGCRPGSVGPLLGPTGSCGGPCYCGLTGGVTATLFAG